MYKGTLWLDYSDDEEEASYKADISRFILRDNNVAFDFFGHDNEEGSYSGNCTAIKQGSKYVGEGVFRYSDGTICKSNVILLVEKDGNELFVSGQWTDENETSPYQLEAELREV